MTLALDDAVVKPNAIAPKLAIVPTPSDEESNPPEVVAFLSPLTCTLPVTIKIEASVKSKALADDGPT